MVHLLFLIYMVIFSFAYLPEQQLLALHDFYNSFNGDKWSDCSWNITHFASGNVSSVYSYCGLSIIKNQNGLDSISELHFDVENNLNGTIPLSIYNLTDLKSFTLQNNQLISGSIPKQICNLKHLQQIVFYNLQFLNGLIPICLANMSSLQWIEFAIMPTMKIHSSLLHTLYQNAINITYFHLESIHFVGSIPSNIGNLLQLKYFYLIDLPLLNSTIPTSIEQLRNLIILDFELSGLYGTIPR
eukprot:202578_1